MPQLVRGLSFIQPPYIPSITGQRLRDSLGYAALLGQLGNNAGSTGKLIFVPPLGV